MADEGPNPRQLGKYLALAQVGVEMVAPIGLGVWLDFILDWVPWLTIAGVVLGFALGIYHLLVLTKQDDSSSREKS